MEPAARGAAEVIDVADLSAQSALQGLNNAQCRARNDCHSRDGAHPHADRAWDMGDRRVEGGRRQSVVIATKVCLDWRDGQPFRNGSNARIQKEIEDSLRRLRTDVIDIYQVHWPDPATPIEETAQALAELHRAGKIRAIGVSNFSTTQMDAFRAAAPLHTVQPPHNLFEREAENDVLPYCRDNNIATLAYGSLCRG